MKNILAIVLLLAIIFLPCLACSQLVTISYGLVGLKTFTYSHNDQDGNIIKSRVQMVAANALNTWSGGGTSGKGFIVHVSEPFSFGKDSLAASLSPRPSFIQSSKNRYKAVYILTNAHVFYNDIARVQNLISSYNTAEIDNLVASKIDFYGASYRNSLGKRYYFVSVHPINYVKGHKFNFRYPLSMNNLGVKVLDWCWEDIKGYYIDEKLVASNGSGCDHTLFRVIVPASFRASSLKLAKRFSIGDKVYVPLLELTSGNQKIIRSIDNRMILSDQDGYTYAPTPGWSGGPLLNRKNQEVVGLIFSAWPGYNRKVLSHDVSYLYNQFKFKEKIQEDLNLILSTRNNVAPPYKAVIYKEVFE